MSDGFSYVDGAAFGLMGVGLIGLQGGMYQMGEYQRQQLNLLRQHQGMPPIAPPPPPRDFFWETICMGTRAFIAIYGAFVAGLYFYGPIVGIFTGLAYFIVMTMRREAKFQRQYARQLQHWAAIGCP